MFRYAVPIDGQWHTFDLRGPIHHIAGRTPGVVEFWAQHDPAAAVIRRTLTVVGTGQPWPDQAVWVGTTLAPGDLVWHLLTPFGDTVCP